MILLQAALPKGDPKQLVSLSLGQRDSCLLALREQTFGSRLDGRIDCPSCSERLEFAIDAADLTQAKRPNEKSAKFTTKVQEYQLTFRLPTSRDIAAVSGHRDVASARNTLLQRCVLDVRVDDAPFSLAEVPDDVLQTLIERMANEDPQADMQFGFECPRCGHEWDGVFDIASFMWTELSALAQRLLQDVHTLATTYGWHEREILSMGAGRRRLYLDMAATR